MKKNDKKSNQRLKSIVLLLLVTGVVIGLVSSTAIKLASATYLMQKTQKPVITIPKIIEQFIDSVVPTQATTTKAPSNGGITTPAPAPTNSGATTTEKEKPTQATTQAPTKPAPTDPVTTTRPPETTDPLWQEKLDQANFDSYKTVVERAKVSGRDYTKTTTRTLNRSFFQSLTASGAEEIEVDGVRYFHDDNHKPVDVEGKANGQGDLFINNSKACLVNTKSLDATKAAVSSSKREELADGSIKITIYFNDEENPQILKYDDTETEGFINAVFPVISAEQVRYNSDEHLGTDIESLDLRYTGCYVELVYFPTSGEIVSLKQVSNCEVEGKDGFLSVGGTITEVNEYVFK